MPSKQQVEKKTGASSKEARPITAGVPVMAGPSLPGKLMKELNSGSGGLECVEVRFSPNGVTETRFLVHGAWMGPSDYGKSKAGRKEAAREQEELHASKAALNKIRERFLISFATPSTLAVAKQILAVPSLPTAADGIFSWSQKRFEPLKKTKDLLVMHLRLHKVEVVPIALAISEIVGTPITWAPRLTTEAVQASDRHNVAAVALREAQASLAEAQAKANAEADAEKKKLDEASKNQ